ncbi:hypothetical protein LTR56_016906 [Elasticomyces elasticus]|nr:hypothetical protein LTR56_016906 [Elasticomyces elasticus]KAK3658675.1 hypothetical protein LTR22_008847 [Elasticomyces elasticus]KAK4913598.1 hypothetical protein LTR49_018117 [Elasticomyces elasticus]KAK5756612.1 hypothetical protein LTS12_013328 [Elasticomyces elasticus]
MSRFLHLPPCLRNDVYSRLVQAADDIYNNNIQASGTAGRGIPTPTSKQQATTFYHSLLSVNKQFGGEFQAEWCRDREFIVTVLDVVSLPVTTLADTEKERYILANGRSYEVAGFVGGFAGAMPDYSVSIDLQRCHDHGYRPIWRHMSDSQMRWIQLSSVQYQKMVTRVEAEIVAAAGTSCKCLPWDGATQILRAFQLSDLMDDEDQSDGGSDGGDDDEEGALWPGEHGGDPCESTDESTWAGGCGEQHENYGAKH